MKIIISIIFFIIAVPLLYNNKLSYYELNYFNDSNTKVTIAVNQKNLKDYIIENNIYYQIQKKEQFISPITSIYNYSVSKKLAGYPWSKHLEDRYIKDYIFPMRIGKEKYQDWKSLFNKKFERILDSLNRIGISKRRDVALCVLKDLNSWFSYDEDIIFNRYPSVDDLLSTKRGDCYTISYVSVMALRAAGIPAALDLCPFWSNKNGGHTEFVFLNDENTFESNVNTEHKNGLLKAPKVYRLLSEENPKLQFLRNKTIHRDLSFLSDLYYVDVTDQHTSVKKEKIHVKNKKMEGEIIYACVYSGNKWHPVALSVVKNSYAQFENLNVAISYRYAYLQDDILYQII